MNLNNKLWVIGSLGAGMALVSTATGRILLFVIRGQSSSSLTSLALLSAGLMLALGGMILLLRLDTQSSVANTKSLSGDSKNVCLRLAWCHLSALTVWLGLPLGNFIFPYLIWSSGRHHSSALNQQGLDCLNFQLSLTLYILLSALMLYVGIGLLMLIGLFMLHLVCGLNAAYYASRGKPYRYPLMIDIIKLNSDG